MRATQTERPYYKVKNMVLRETVRGRGEAMRQVSRLLDRLSRSKMPLLMKQPIISLRKTGSKIIARKAAERLAKNIRYCNVCGWRGKRFTTCYNEIMLRDEEIACPNCLSEPRQRAFFKYLQENFLTTYLYTLKENNFLCLEIGPDRSNPVEKALPGIVYVSTDLDKSHAMFEMDLTTLTFRDSTFDLVVCSHVLEHIEDDFTAMEQIYRVLKKGGTALIQVPVGYYEEPSGKCTVEFGERRFCEHFRSYGWDLKERLVKAGFKVNIIRYTDVSMRLDMQNEAIFECKK